MPGTNRGARLLPLDNRFRVAWELVGQPTNADFRFDPGRDAGPPTLKLALVDVLPGVGKLVSEVGSWGKGLTSETIPTRGTGSRGKFCLLLGSRAGGLKVTEVIQIGFFPELFLVDSLARKVSGKRSFQ
jgi:hypothetical protein